MRSDIFSFGVAIFEMLTGRLPFRGEHEAAMMYSIINEEPEPVTKFLHDASSDLLHLLGRALEKNPDDRYQSAADMVIDLRRLQKQTTKVSRVLSVPQPADGSSERSSGADSQKAPLRTSSKKLTIAGAAAIVLIAAAIYFLFPKIFQSDSLLSTAFSKNLSMRVLQIPLSQVSYPGISADGNWIAFPGAGMPTRCTQQKTARRDL